MNSQLLSTKGDAQIILFTLTDVEDVKISKNLILGNKKVISELLYEGELNKSQTVKEIGKYYDDITRLSFGSKITYVFIVSELKNKNYEPVMAEEKLGGKFQPWQKEEDALLFSDRPSIVAQVIGRTEAAVISRISSLKANKLPYYKQLKKAGSVIYNNGSIQTDDSRKIEWTEQEDIFLFAFSAIGDAAKFLNVSSTKCSSRKSYLKRELSEQYEKIKAKGEKLKPISEIKEKAKMAAMLIEGNIGNTELLEKYEKLANIFTGQLHLGEANNTSQIANSPIQNTKQEEITPTRQSVTEHVAVIEQPVIMNKPFIFILNDVRVIFNKQPSSIRIAGNDLYID